MAFVDLFAWYNAAESECRGVFFRFSSVRFGKVLRAVLDGERGLAWAKMNGNEHTVS